MAKRIKVVIVGDTPRGMIGLMEVFMGLNAEVIHVEDSGQFRGHEGTILMDDLSQLSENHLEMLTEILRRESRPPPLQIHLRPHDHGAMHICPVKKDINRGPQFNTRKGRRNRW